MSLLYLPNRGELIRPAVQPDYPDCDLTDQNAAYMHYYLTSEAGVRARSAEIRTDQEALFTLAALSFQLLDTPIDESHDGQSAFSDGFVAEETVIDLVRPVQTFNLPLACRNAPALFVVPTAEFDMISGFSQWPGERPVTYATIANLGPDTEPPARTRSRLIGAYVAHNLARRQLELDAA
jgi:hypothetical protein